jgi:carotenoid cleavage dioxygenase-like enzyme
MTNFFEKIKKIKIKTKYISMIHDFISLNNTLIIADVPMIFNFNLFEKPYSPLKFDYNKKSQFILINTTNNEKKYLFNRNIFAFSLNY